MHGGTEGSDGAWEQTTVQALSLRATQIASCKGGGAALLVANNCIYRLRPVPMARQVRFPAPLSSPPGARGLCLCRCDAGGEAAA